MLNMITKFDFLLSRNRLFRCPNFHKGGGPRIGRYHFTYYIDKFGQKPYNHSCKKNKQITCSYTKFQHLNNKNKLAHLVIP